MATSGDKGISGLAVLVRSIVPTNPRNYFLSKLVCTERSMIRPQVIDLIQLEVFFLSSIFAGFDTIDVGFFKFQRHEPQKLPIGHMKLDGVCLDAHWRVD